MLTVSVITEMRKRCALFVENFDLFFLRDCFLIVHDERENMLDGHIDDAGIRRANAPSHQALANFSFDMLRPGGARDCGGGGGGGQCPHGARLRHGGQRDGVLRTRGGQVP